MIAAALGLGGFRESDGRCRRFRPQPGTDRSAIRRIPPIRHPRARWRCASSRNTLGTDAEFQNGKLMLAGHADPDLARPLHRHQLRRSARHVPERIRWPISKPPPRAGNKDQAPEVGEWQDRADRYRFRRRRSHAPRRSTRSSAGPKWTTPGVEIHANTVRTLLERRFTWCRSRNGCACWRCCWPPAVTVWIATTLVAAGRAAVLRAARSGASSWLPRICCSRAA